uniref:Retrovirus-related Pol polyprotein from transposon TNT 1-94 n=1 Tax=Cajanus cajan TaxID=3821 RepID=A0A151SEU1_CAJCA|nr:Retrovirus-related Pol polyprotein from transposon TNT 1-94 [Cajanus cajan]
MSSSLNQKEKTKMIEQDRSAIILCLGDKALKEVAREKTIIAMWLKQDDLENIEVQLEDEDKALFLLNSLPRNFEHFKDAILYGKELDITLDEVQTSIRTKELQRQQDHKTDDNGESLNVSRGRSEKKGTKSERKES